jgi:uncharacterized alpha-E superfamily protein
VLELDAATVSASHQLGVHLRSFVAEAASVGEFLPSGISRVLTDVAALIDSFSAGPAMVDTIDDVLASLAAFAGMWNESTVRGPAWRFGDIGLRVERGLAVLELTSVLATADGGDAANVASLEVLLAANESLVAYRRQHRSDVALAPTLELLLRDSDNPRGLLPSMERVAEHVADVGWYDGTATIRRLIDLVTEVSIDELASAEHLAMIAAELSAFADGVVGRWFATPVKPMLMHAGRAAGMG